MTQPATGMNDEDPTDLHATPNPAGYVPESPTSSEVSTAVEEIPETSFASAGTLGVHGNSSGDTDEMEERSIEKMLADEVHACHCAAGAAPRVWCHFVFVCGLGARAKTREGASAVLRQRLRRPADNFAADNRKP